MINITSLKDCTGAERYGTCSGCGKNSKESKDMVRIIFTHGSTMSHIALCKECHDELAELMRDKEGRTDA